MTFSDLIFQELLVYCRVKALEDCLNPTPESIWKSITRSYSEKFGTPLAEVRAMDPEAVLSEVFEAQYEEIDIVEKIEDILEDLYKIENPDYEKVHKVEMDSFMKNLEKREKKRLRKEKVKEEQRLSSYKPGPQTKTGGSVDFSKLKDDK